MKYIIDIDALKECLDLLPTSHSNINFVDLDDVKKMIDKFPKEKYDFQFSNQDEDGCKQQPLVGRWVYWSGWRGNHDMRIDDAVCSECGYKHPTVRYEKNDGFIRSKQDGCKIVLNKLSDKCPECGAIMQKE